MSLQPMPISGLRKIDDYHKIEIEEIFSVLRLLVSLRVQVYSFFGTANLAVLGFALNTKNAGLILIAASIIGLLTLVDRRLRYSYNMILSRGIELEDIYSHDTQIAILHKLAQHSDYTSRSLLKVYWLPLFAFITEVVMGSLSWFYLGWTWF